MQSGVLKAKEIVQNHFRAREYAVPQQYGRMVRKFWTFLGGISVKKAREKNSKIYLHSQILKQLARTQKLRLSLLCQHFWTSLETAHTLNKVPAKKWRRITFLQLNFDIKNKNLFLFLKECFQGGFEGDKRPGPLVVPTFLRPGQWIEGTQQVNPSTSHRRSISTLHTTVNELVEYAFLRSKKEQKKFIYLFFFHFLTFLCSVVRNLASGQAVQMRPYRSGAYPAPVPPLIPLAVYIFYFLYFFLIIFRQILSR